MPGSQLKRLKASLREQGIIGPQQSKKQKRRNAQDERAKGKKRLEKRAALDGIREQFNPFDLKHNARGPKFEVTSNRPATGNAAKGIFGRPSEAKAAGEERRRQTLLVEMQRRNKVGGLLDRRFGEDDPTMTPEEKMLERFAREKQRAHKKSAMFDLEDDEDGEGYSLTHMGQSLSLDEPALKDDFEEDDIEGGSNGDSDDEGKRAYLKRKQLTDAALADGHDDTEDGQPERKKTKQEVYEEIIAKSKAYKYERQAAKEADEDLREELDKELPNLQQLLLLKEKDAKSATAQDQAATTAAEKERLDREYDFQVKKLAQDRRAQPAERTKTAEEKAEQDAARLKELEEKRLRRMRGEEDSDEEGDEDDASKDKRQDSNVANDFEEMEEEDDFGLGKGIKTRPTATELGLDDEDDFLIEDFVTSGSDVSENESEEESSEDDHGESDGKEVEDDDNEDDEFTKGLLTEQEAQKPEFSISLGDSGQAAEAKNDADNIPYTFPCPRSHEELLGIVAQIPVEKLITVVQRIRSLYHPKLDSSNKVKLATFSKLLIQHLLYLSSQPHLPPFTVLENLIRHIHSLAKTYPVEVAEEFRSHLEELGERPLVPNLGDLILLTAIGTIFPTSDHFHQVVTPAILSIARYLGQKVPQKVADYTKGCYLAILALQYQQASKRYVPELISFSLNTLLSLAPSEAKGRLGDFPVHQPPREVRIHGAQPAIVRRLSCLDCVESPSSEDESVAVRIAVIDTTIKTLDAAADLWSSHSAFFETFEPFNKVLAHLSTKPCRSEFPDGLNSHITKAKAKIERMLSLAHMSRRPLELHHHRPLAIKSNIPKFEDSFDPNKHYDPDRERAELAKLRAEHKKERKGALRELRKDANFMAREKLRIKKAKDAAYEKKFKRLVAEIQGEEGREANAYEREKKLRKRAAKR